LGCKPTSTLMEANVDLWFDDSHTLDDPERYKRLIGKLIYLTVTRPDIIFVVGVLSRFMHQPREVCWSVALRILPYIKSCPRKSLVYRKRKHARISVYSDSGYVGDQDLCWRKSCDLEEQEQDIVSRSSAKIEYRAMAHTACKMVWLKNLLMEFDFRQPELMHMHCDN